MHNTPLRFARRMSDPINDAYAITGPAFAATRGASVAVAITLLIGALAVAYTLYLG